MTTAGDVSVGVRLRQVLQHLGISRAHVAAGDRRDAEGLLTTAPETIASLILRAVPMDVALLQPLADRVLVFGGDQGPPIAAVARWLPQVPGVRHVVLKDYVQVAWSDLAADCTAELGAALSTFLAEMSAQQQLPRIAPPAGEGEVAGVTYRIAGAGPPLVLLPLALAPSQWQPLVPGLSQTYCTITLTGPALGMAATLEERGTTAGYLRAVSALVDALVLRPGERILDVGCGSGVLDRWLVRRTGGANPTVGVDINRYLLSEAAALARREGLEGNLTFEEGNAEALPFPDDSFDVALSVTTMEEGDADRMLAEFVRVTRPGGRLGVMVRADIDLPAWVNVRLRTDLKAKVEAPGRIPGKDERGCADASLYERFPAAGLAQVHMFPQLVSADSGPFRRFLATQLEARLTPEERAEWWAAIAQAEAAGTYFIAMPFHCAVGTKP